MREPDRCFSTRRKLDVHESVLIIEISMDLLCFQEGNRVRNNTGILQVLPQVPAPRTLSLKLILTLTFLMLPKQQGDNFAHCHLVYSYFSPKARPALHSKDYHHHEKIDSGTQKTKITCANRTGVFQRGESLMFTNLYWPSRYRWIFSVFKREIE